MTNQKGLFRCQHCDVLFRGVGVNIYCSISCALWSRVQRGGEDGCWPWLGAKHHFGYGDFSFRGNKYRAHRVAYQLRHGWENTPEVIRHECDNPVCCNPSHLIGGTQAENMDDMAKRLRSANRKIPVEDIPEIRRRRENGETLSALGREYNVSPQAIRNVVTNQVYKHF